MDEAPKILTREEQVSKNQAAAKALLKEASRLKNDPYAMAPPRVVAAANELMGALTIVGRKPAADAIVRIMVAVPLSRKTEPTGEVTFKKRKKEVGR
jgi:hypothetical protein